MENQVAKYDNRIYQLDELITDLYNAVYAKSGNYQTKLIDVGDLNLTRFKLTDYDLNVIFDQTPIKYDNDYPTGLMRNGHPVKQLWFKRKGETHMSTIRIIPYSGPDVLDDMSDPVNVNQIMKTLLSELVVTEKSNNILLPVINVDVKGSDLVDYPKVNPLVERETYYSVEITEKFYSLMTLDKFLREYPLTLPVIKTIIYQVIDTIHQITNIYPNFRYNQLIPELIDCYLKSDNGTIYPQIKLSDFFLAEITDLVPNNYLKTEQSESITLIDSNYGDIYQFLNYLWNHINPEIQQHSELVELFDSILPKKIRSDKIYLTKELWDSLSDSEKFDLRAKNILNNPLFHKNNILPTKYLSDEYDNMARFKNEFPNDLTTEQTFVSDSPRFDIFQSELNTVTENLGQVSPENKKYSNYDIEIMSHKISNNKNKTLKQSSKYDLEEETEENRIQTPSKLISVTDSEVAPSKHNKSKLNQPKLRQYHGQRHIGNHANALSDLNEYVNNLTNANNFQNLQAMQNMPNTNNFLANPSNFNLNSQPNADASRINSIGGLLGFGPNELGRMPGANYSQVAQQLSQQYGFNPGANTMPAQFAAPMVNPMPQTMPQAMPQAMPQMNAQPDGDAYYKYLAAISQLNQNQDNSAFKSPNNFAPQMQPYAQMFGTNQMGGDPNQFNIPKNGNFFFR